MYKKQNLTYSAKESAIYLLSRRDHGAFELHQKLLIKGYELPDVEEAVQYCREHRYLDDLRYAKSQIRQHISKQHGLRRIQQALNHKRVSEEVISQAMEAETTDWFELARQAADKKFRGQRAKDQKEYAKQVRFLQYRGFDYEQISYALSGEQS
jgi:regulatory protein